MKVFYPVVFGFITVIFVSFFIGSLFPSIFMEYPYSATFYLLLCFAQIVHSIEEYFTQFWDHIGEAFLIPLIIKFRKTEPLTLDKSFFIAGNIALIGIMLLYFRPIEYGASWAWFFGIVIAFVEIGNGILHCGTAISQRKYYSGSVSGVFTLIAGFLLLVSMVI